MKRIMPIGECVEMIRPCYYNGERAKLNMMFALANLYLADRKSLPV